MTQEAPPVPPRIALVGGHAGRSGVPSYLRQVARALLPTGARLTVITDAPPAGEEGGYGFVARMGLARRTIPGLARSRNPLRLLAAAAALRREILSGGHDLVWANSSFPTTVARLAMIEARLRRRGPRALIVTCHGASFGPGRAAHVGALARLVEWTLLAAGPAQDIVFVSGRDRAAYPPRLLARHRITLLPNVSDLGARAAPERPPGPLRVLMTTRDARQKNLEAAAQILARLPDGAELHLYGQGTDGPALRARLAALLPPAALERIRFHGPRDEATLAAALAAADVYLLTSRYEGMPIGALEAFAAGLPVAMTDVGGAEEIGAAHPFFARIATATPADLDAAARAVVDLAARFNADRAAHAAEAAAACARAFPPGGWAEAVRLIAARALAAPPGGGGGR